jgi:hypothetical protein
VTLVTVNLKGKGFHSQNSLARFLRFSDDLVCSLSTSKHEPAFLEAFASVLNTSLSDFCLSRQEQEIPRSKLLSFVDDLDGTTRIV